MASRYTFTESDLNRIKEMGAQGLSFNVMGKHLGKPSGTIKSLCGRAERFGWEKEYEKARFETEKQAHYKSLAGDIDVVRKNDASARVRNWWDQWNTLHDDGRLLKLERIPEKVLVFSCTQAPYEHKGFLPFLSMVIAEHKPELVVMMGDLLDLKFAKKSFMAADDLSPTQELERAIEFAQQLFRIVPQAICLTSNHLEGRVSYAQTQSNLPSAFLRKWQDVVGMPNGWITRDYLMMRDWMCEHGHDVSKGSRPSIREEMVRRFGKPYSVLRAHRHGLFGEQIVPYWETPTQQVRLCYTGCGMDEKQVTYTRSGLWNGCILLQSFGSQSIPVPIPMERSANGEWTQRLV